MKKTLPLSQCRPLSKTSVSKLHLLGVAILFCACSNLYANVKTSHNKAISQPTITSFSPGTGAPGTLVTINGTALNTPTALTIGGQNAIVVSNTGSALVAMVMPNAATGAVSITTSGGTASGSSNFTVTATKYPSFQQGAKLVGSGTIGAADQGFSVSLSADGNTAVVGGSQDNSNQGAAWIYTRNGVIWTQQGAKLVGTGNLGPAEQGLSVAISADGNTAIVGATGDNSNLGAAWVYTRNGSTWTQQGPKLVGTGSVGAAQQGISVSLSADGNTAFVGGYYDNSKLGAAWLFTRSGGIWTQQGPKLVGTGSVGAAGQGCSVSLSADGNTALMGGFFDNSNQGAGWVFTRSGSTWTQQGSKLVGTGSVGSPYQGTFVSLNADGNTAIIGGYYDNSGQGAAWVYTRNAGIWAQQGSKLVGTDNEGPAQQGWAVSLSADGNSALVGGPNDNSAQGAAWVYTRSGGTWAQHGSKIVGSGNAGAAQQGVSISLSADGNTALAGGGADNSYQGAAWVYAASTTGFPPPPIISYSSPQTYNVNLTISPLVPVNTGSAVASSTTVNIASGFNSLRGIAVDATGNVYVADNGNSIVEKIPASGGTPIILGSGFNHPDGIAVDAAGNVYITDTNNNAVKKILANGGAILTLGSGFNAPYGIALDTAGNIYIGDSGSNSVKKIPVGGGSTVTLASGFNLPTGVAVDAGGNIYVADRNNYAVKEIVANGGGILTLGSGFNAPNGVAVDAAGNVFVADQGNDAIKRIPAGGGLPVVVGSGLTLPVSVAVDGKDNVFLADDGTAVAVKQITAGGYFISPALPTGLIFDNATGTISGTPNVQIPATNYTVTAYNSGGSSSAVLKITVSAPPPPILHYSSPQNYTLYTTISPVGPVNTGGGVPSASITVAVASGFSSLKGIAVDGAGNLYVADLGNSLVEKIPAVGGPLVVLGSGFNHPSGVAVDAAGNVYVTDTGNNAVKEIPVGGGAIVTLGSGFNAPYGITLDAEGNIYIADSGNNSVKKIPSGGTSTITLASGFSMPTGVAVDGAGNVYVSDYYGNAVKKILANGTGVISLGPVFNSPTGVAIDAGGNIFVAESTYTIKRIPAGGGIPVTLGTGLYLPVGIAIDQKDNVFVADNGFTATVKQIAPGGYYVSPNLPAGLNFDNNTGIISGTPTVASAAADYTITGYNSGGNGSTIVNIASVVPAAPLLSYTSPQTYNISTAISPLAPVNTGGAVASSTTLTLASGFNSLRGVAIDNKGNAYVADNGSSTIEKIPAGGGAPVILGSGFNHPDGIAVDTAGNVYITDTDNNAVKKIVANGGAIITLGSGFNLPYGIALDAAGNIYVGDSGSNSVKKIPIGGGGTITLATGFNTPTGVAVDAAGNVYVCDRYNNAVKEIPPGGGSVVTLGAGFNIPNGVAVDAAGNIFVADQGNNMIKRMPAGGGTPVTLGSGFSLPVSVAIDGKDNVFVGDDGATVAVKQITPGGYYASPNLPAGLNFDNNTGIISGTPTAAAPATNYTISGYNVGGASMAILNIAVNPSPTLTYSSPKTYTTGTAITPLTPTGTGVAAPAFSGSPAVIGSGFSSPTSVAVSTTGNVYVVDFGHKLVKKIPPGGAPVTIGTGFVSPYGVAADALGNVYVADYGNNSIKKIPSGGGAPVSLGSGFVNPTGVAVDTAGNVYVADYGNNAVKEIPVGGGATVTLGSGFSHPAGVAVDGLGNVYVADYGNSAVKKIPAGGGAIVTLGSGFNAAHGVAVDGSGNVFVADYGNNAVKEIPVGGGAPITLGAGFTHPAGIAIDGADNVYVADLGNNAAKQVKPVGGYYINTELPAGLAFANSTGTISGTPTANSPATNYTVTGWNVNGSGTATVNINVYTSLIPIFSYSSPQSYTVGIAITALSPTSNGVAAAGFSGTPVITGTGFSGPTSVAADSAGNVFVADEGHKLVKKIPAGGGAPVTIGSGFVTPYGVAVDGSGNVFVADYGNNTIKEIPVGGGAPVSLSSGFLTPTGVAVDRMGNVYVADFGNNAVKKIPIGGGGVAITIGSGFSHPAGVAVDGLGNVYVADYGNNAVKMIPGGSGAPIILGSGFLAPHGVAVDGSGNVFVADYNNNAVKEIPAGGGAPVILGTGFSHPVGIAVNMSDNVYVADFSNNAVKHITPVGGYYIGSSLPAGLSFSDATGTISGTPAAATSATNYTVTAYNGYGGNTAVVNIAVAPSPVPVISYSNPPAYTTGTAITPLTPTSSGVDAAGFNGIPAIFGSGFSSPTSVAVDPAGNIYVADEGHKLVMKIPAGGGGPVSIGSGFVTPYGVAADASGNAYVADYGNNSITKIPVGGGAQVTLGSGFLTPTGVAVDNLGNVYVADFGHNAVKEIPVGGGAPVTLGAGFVHPAAVAVDGLGNVYVADYSNNAIKKIPAAGGATVVLASGFNGPHGVSVDGTGNVFVADYGNNAVKEIPVSGGAAVILGSGFNHPIGIATDLGDVLYIADFSNNAVKRINPAGGYYISASLPAGLSFSNATGTISGTPTAGSPATNYTVSAWNSYGSAPATVNIQVNSNNASLASLAISSGTLAPAFASGTNSYTAMVSNSVTSVTVTPAAADPNAVIRVNGTIVASGSASPSIALAVGANNITTAVTAQDGVTIDTYTITVNRTGAGMNSLDELSVTKPSGSLAIAADGIVIHQGLSPNGDGVNDVFTIDGLTKFPDNKVTIMDRSGNVIYAAQGYDNASKVFDGHSSVNGVMQLPGTYFYLLEYKSGADVKRATGFVILKY